MQVTTCVCCEMWYIYAWIRIDDPISRSLFTGQKNTVQRIALRQLGQVDIVKNAKENCWSRLQQIQIFANPTMSCSCRLHQHLLPLRSTGIFRLFNQMGLLENQGVLMRMLPFLCRMAVHLFYFIHAKSSSLVAFRAYSQWRYLQNALFWSFEHRDFSISIVTMCFRGRSILIFSRVSPFIQLQTSRL